MAFRDGRVEPKSTLIWAKGIVELHAVAPVHPYIALIILPFDLEGDGPVRLCDPLKHLVLDIKRIIVDRIDNRGQDLTHCLDEFRLSGIASLEVRHEAVKIVHIRLRLKLKSSKMARQQ